MGGTRSRSTQGAGNVRIASRTAGALLLLFTACRAANLNAPPGQPASGPGGADYSHGKVISQRFGEGNDEYWLFQPEDPRPAEAPVVVFLHGWGGINPRFYGAWIQHIVRKGHIVVYPRYQASLTTSAADMEPAALGAVQSALARLSAEGPVRPRPGAIAWVGHSLGGILAANLAAAYVEHGLPQPAVLMSVQPGGESRLPVDSLAGLPPTTLVLLVVGDDDRTVADRGVAAIAAGLNSVPHENVERVVIRSDRRSTPPLVADHFAPLASAADFPRGSEPAGDFPADDAPPVGPLRRRMMQRQAERYAPDALDYYGFWKLLDGMLDAAFRGTHREYAFGGTPQQLSMGRLSDGTPVTPLEVLPR